MTGRFIKGLLSQGINPDDVCDNYRVMNRNEINLLIKHIPYKKDICRCVCGTPVKNKYFIINQNTNNLDSTFMVAHNCLDKYIRKNNSNNNNKSGEQCEKQAGTCYRCKKSFLFTINKDKADYFCYDCYKLTCKNCEKADKKL